MTKLLVTARNHDEIDVALSSGADIVDFIANGDMLVDLLRFADKKKKKISHKGEQVVEGLRETKNALEPSVLSKKAHPAPDTPHFWVQCDRKIFAHPNWKDIFALADIICVPESFHDRPKIEHLIQSVTRLSDIGARKSKAKKWMLVLEQFPKSVARFSDKNCDDSKQLEQDNFSKESHCALEWPFFSDDWGENTAKWHGEGFDGVMLETKAPLLSVVSLAQLASFIEQAHACGLIVALSGFLEPPDIPRLLTLSPDIICFARDERRARDYFSRADLRHIIRTLITGDTQQCTIKGQVDFGTDRLIVRDFILPVEIGAYHHERGKTQRVRFNVFADVARLSSNPQDMRHIVSYDLIMDAIRQLVASGHVDLVETLAEKIAANLLTQSRIKHVVVRVEKLDLGPEAVGVEIERYSDRI